MTKRQKTNVESNILLLDIPKQIIAKYNNNTYREGKLFPVLSNQKMNAYLKEIADICGIVKKSYFPHGSPYICDHVAQQGRSYGKCVEDTGTY